ncbi:hypothetical protein BJ878DRAFT_424754 [Calycina marina]|uniref:Uncharacterized protein n=1 Tax=Calycina marina TaxID=1763456 RepID=A0A9P7Z019_9HELO|nr:hypothetical protein BJ878DRAFT_424754 [Calycina marina]
MKSSRHSSDISSTSSSSAYSYDQSPRYSMDGHQAPVVVSLRCSRCTTCVETISSSKKVSAECAQGSGMVRFGTNLYYCERCAKMVGYQ